MSKRQELERYPELVEGMVVRTRDEKKLGKIAFIGENSITVEKGFFFPKDFVVSYNDFAEVREGDLFLKLGESDYEPWREESYTGWSQDEGMSEAGPAEENISAFGKDISSSRRLDLGEERAVPEKVREIGTAIREDAKSIGGDLREPATVNLAREEVRVPVMEEKLEVEKIRREAGEVQIHKTLRTEERHFTVPVTKEEVRIERTPVAGGRDATEGDRSFQDQTIRVPVFEEEVEIHKHPVVKEEILVRKESHQELRSVDETVREEEVEIRQTGKRPSKKEVA